jgi:glycosyltransferase involved in cell wall biosynthesis
MKPPVWHISVLVPARNEEALLPRCIASILAARSRLPAAVSCDVVVAVDRSTDRTQDIAEALLAGHGIVIAIQAGSVGAARAAAAETALRRYRGLPRYCWLANTDADCEVPIDWLADQLVIAERGIEAVAGIVTVDSFAGHDSGVAERFRLSYSVYADGTHPHVHGANMGVRADAYLRAGGWSSHQTAEDHDLWNRLHQSGHHRLSAAKLQVTTSGRRTGRAPHGFAQALAAHNGAAS